MSPSFTDGGRFAFTVEPYRIFTHDGDSFEGPEVPPTSHLSFAMRTYVTHAGFHNLIRNAVTIHKKYRYKMFGFWYDIVVLEIREVDIGRAYPGLRVTCEVASVEGNTSDLLDVKLSFIKRIWYGMLPSRTDMLVREKRKKMLKTKRSLCSWDELESHVESMRTSKSKTVRSATFSVSSRISKSSPICVTHKFARIACSSRRRGTGKPSSATRTTPAVGDSFSKCSGNWKGTQKRTSRVSSALYFPTRKRRSFFCSCTRRSPELVT